jgi:HAD superfamily phosphatase (TIGR01681 family)
MAAATSSTPDPILRELDTPPLIRTDRDTPNLRLRSPNPLPSPLTRRDRDTPKMRLRSPNQLPSRSIPRPRPRPAPISTVAAATAQNLTSISEPTPHPSIGSRTNKWIALDVDKTLIAGHTGGRYTSQHFSQQYIIQLMGGLERGQKLVEAMGSLQQQGYQFVIVSRGNYDSVIQLLQALNITQFFNPNQILAANMPEHVRSNMGIQVDHPIYSNHPQGGEKWAKIKTQYMKAFARTHNISLSNIYFFDDTKMNVTEARHSIPNSFVVNNAKKTESLEYYLDKLARTGKLPPIFTGGKSKRGTTKHKRRRNRKHKTRSKHKSRSKSRSKSKSRRK